jgi:hypothetical protein
LTFKLEALAQVDPIYDDRKMGICPVPLYDFSEAEYDAIAGGQDPEGIQEILRRRDVMQYFYPPSDQLTLGLVDRGINDPNTIIDQLTGAPKLGHPLAQPEIISKVSSLSQVIDELKSRDLLVEGEMGWEVSEQGKAARVTVKFAPREGLISKLINRLSISLDLKDIFGPR